MIVTRRRPKRSAKDIKKEVKRLVGKKVVELSEQTKEECVILIHDLLSPFGVSREEARNVFTILTDTRIFSPTSACVSICEQMVYKGKIKTYDAD